MMNTRFASRTLLSLLFSAALLLDNSAHALFHFMQIEQVIGGVNGDTTAQAVQLRMRSGGQSVLSSSSIRAYDATGANEVLLDDPTTNVLNSAAGSRVLIATPNFANYSDFEVADFDFVIENPIPASYLAAGQITFNSNSPTIDYWILSWGGSGFTGPTNGLTSNDADGEFGPPVDIALPSDSLQALLFQGPSNALSTTNLADYALTAGAATFTNNAGTSFTLVDPVVENANFDGDNDIDGFDFLTWQRNNGGPGGLAQGDANNDGAVDGDDLAIWEEQYGTVPPIVGIAAVPEPQTLWLLASGLIAGCGPRSRRRRR